MSTIWEACKAETEALLKSRYKYYEFGNKLGKILALQIRQSASVQHITQISTVDDMTIDPQTINDQFRKFYASLYRSERSSDEAQLDNFFRPLNVPSTDCDTSSRLYEPFTVEGKAFGNCFAVNRLYRPNRVCEG